MSFLRKWMKWQIRFFFSLLVIGVSVITFGCLAVTFWPDSAWGTTAVFTVVIIWIVSRYEPGKK
jgi:hypothetical protein